MTTSEPVSAAGAKRRNIALLLEYDGLPFRGWQAQREGPTVQQALEEAISRVTGERSRVTGSGRTDAGVHALGQVANFRTSASLSPEALARALTAVLPPAVAVRAAREVHGSFDARRSAAGKVYRYRIFLRRHRSPLELGRSWHVPYPLAVAAMRRAAAAMTGRRDFSSFRAAGCASRSAVRDLRLLRLRRRGEILEIETEADGFLRHMVRSIVGTLVDVGRGRLTPSAVPAMLAARDRGAAGPTAPAHGLYLVEAKYPGGALFP